ncbi:dimethylsulfonioproprionate lyase family protein [Glycocaulis sp.]|uniref:dimethylsulfonioproprionate lyase family protein n=1 Tax=Glycocaulis sp. TaxID=1969725 RepID=UPI00345BB3F4|nr:hypothetical protein [Glycocaulis sp.]
MSRQRKEQGFAFGITLIGPQTYYDWHQHPAVETYACLSPESKWGLNHAPLTKRPVGTVILHPSNAPHAMETGEYPLLAPWLWTGNIDSPARMEGSGENSPQ